MIDSNTRPTPADGDAGGASQSPSEPTQGSASPPEGSATPRSPDAESKDAPAEDDTQRRLRDLETALAESEDRWKRSAAQLQNERRRFQNELERVRRVEREDVLRAWLDVVDNLDRAMQVEGDRDNPWFEGMKAIRAQMNDVLRRFDVVEIEAAGATFDPERHEAVATANVPDRKEGSILEVVQKGYRLDDRTLRHAKVIPVKHG